ncbi:DNA primase regulatory subunit PriL [Methanoregula sp.]|uniref:DNA primase regulatory subunit PriL n=1 Tax=Methanoregula sp. TaxID=2052170 RepID=UPI002BEF1F43|nr:DNA primase regulatory subunit PriL [Methanoregula sp.]HVP95822.1 DNA primase regulatory subunit PriL [Methanoregula sp.]
MEYVPSGKEISHFPFLKKAQDPIRTRFASLGSLLSTPKGQAIVAFAVARIQDALSQKKTRAPEVHESPEDEIAAYALARIIVSCVNDKQLIDRLTRYEAERAYYFLVNEEEWNSRYRQGEGEYSRLWDAIAEELGIRIENDRMPVPDYVELVAPLHDDRYRLINRHVVQGYVTIDKSERYDLLRERVRVLLRRDLPHRVPKEICEQLAPKAAEIKKIYQEQMLRQFGKVEEGAFPPCVQALISALAAGTNLTHAGRFSLTAFLHNIGMDITGIAELYARSPDFDIEKTMYQVEHITGRGGTSTEYTTPACAAMQTTGLCVHRDAICEKISHPLSYYKLKKSRVPRRNAAQKDEPKPAPSADNP